MSTSRLRNLIVESPTSIGGKARLRRWNMFSNVFPEIREMHVLDLGGTVETWERCPIRPKSVTVLNLFPSAATDGHWVMSVAGDACQAKTVLAESGFRDGFDLVYSNSLIEHLGGHARRAEFAQQVADLAPRHWVQTPYRYFPLEPHWLFPGMQFLPVAARTHIAQHWPLAHTKPSSRAEARSEVLWTELVGKADMGHYFPQSEIVSEKIFGLTKSLIAIGRT